MTPQAATKQTPAPQTPPLPQAKPESLGLSPTRLQRMSDAFKREIDKGTLPGATVMVARRGQIGWFDALGRQSPAASAPMAHDTHLPHLLDDQADRLGRHHDAGRGRPFPAQRSRCEIHPGIRRPEGRRREQRQARTGAAEAADDGPGSVAAHFRHHLRPHRQQPGAAALQAGAAAQPQDHQRRARRHGREPAADLPARRGMELQPLHRHPRPHHRGRLRQELERVPRPSASWRRCRWRRPRSTPARKTPAASPSRSRPIPGPARRCSSSTCWRSR